MRKGCLSAGPYLSLSEEEQRVNSPLGTAKASPGSLYGSVSTTMLSWPNGETYKAMGKWAKGIPGDSWVSKYKTLSLSRKYEP